MRSGLTAMPYGNVTQMLGAQQYFWGLRGPLPPHPGDELEQQVLR